MHSIPSSWEVSRLGLDSPAKMLIAFIVIVFCYVFIMKRLVVMLAASAMTKELRLLIGQAFKMRITRWIFRVGLG